MFENKFFETILAEMLANVSEQNADLDVNPGSVIYTALAPIALELETAYREMDMIIDETFLETASKEYLVKHGNQLGVKLNEATSARFVGEFDVDVNIGSRFSLDTFTYVVVDTLSEPDENNTYYTCELVCETVGSTPNGYLGNLIPITYVPNLTHAKLVSVLVYGEDEEETEEYRDRLQTHLSQSASDGNVAQYAEWLDVYDGVGKYRITPLWNGANTVKLTVLNSENGAASEELLNEVQEYFDPIASQGMGDGQAPIGAVVTVDTVTEVPVVINCELALKDGYTTPLGVQDAVDSYLKSIVLSKSTISYMAISAVIYNNESVTDVKNLTITINGIVMDTETTPFIDSVTIATNEIAVLDIENSVWSV